MAKKHISSRFPINNVQLPNCLGKLFKYSPRLHIDFANRVSGNAIEYLNKEGGNPSYYTHNHVASVLKCETSRCVRIAGIEGNTASIAIDRDGGIFFLQDNRLTVSVATKSGRATLVEIGRGHDLADDTIVTLTTSFFSGTRRVLYYYKLSRVSYGVELSSYGKDTYKLPSWLANYKAEALTEYAKLPDRFNWAFKEFDEDLPPILRAIKPEKDLQEISQL